MDFVKELLGNFGAFDIVVVAGTALLGLRCLMRGFVKEVFSLAGIVGAVVLSRMYHEEAAAIFRPMVDNDLQANVAGYAAIAVGSIVGAALAAWILHRIIKRNVLGTLDRIGGLVVGLLQGALLFGVGLLVAETLLGGVVNNFVSDSILAPYLLDLVKFLSGIVFANT